MPFRREVKMEQALDLATCKECGAANASTARDCWLCGAAVRPALGMAPPPLPGARAVAAPPSERGWKFGLTLLLVVIALVAVGFGIVREAAGLAVLYAIVVTPALLATLIATARRRSAGRPMGGGDKFKTFFIWVCITLAAIPLLGIAAVVALVLYCFAVM